MFDQVLDNFRKATESTLQLQQEMFKHWAQAWAQAPGTPVMPTMPAMPTMPLPTGTEFPGKAWAEQWQAFQKQFAKAITEMLKKHRDTLDAQYDAGVKAIEDAFRLGDAKDPAQYRKLTEELWRHSFDCLKTVAEDQMREFQAASEKWYEAVSKGFVGVRK